MTLTEAAEAVIAVIDRDGWYQGPPPGGADTRVCLMWAMSRATRESGRYDSARVIYELEERMRPLAQAAGFPSVVDFNDSPRTTLEDVKLMIKRACDDAW